MGYDLHITRREHWAEDEEAGNDISLEEWRAYVDADPELRWADAAERDTALWFAREEDRERDDLPWLWWTRDEVVSKNPAFETRRKMWLVAQALSANLQGDDDERYGPDGEMIPEPQHVRGGSAKPWWKFW